MNTTAPQLLSPAISHGSRHAWVVLGSLTLLAAVSFLFACSVGSVSLSASDLLGAIGEALGGTNSTLAATLLELRMSRALAGFATGAMLALAGVMMQALLRNPLADPYVLGVSGGASVGALAAMLFLSAGAAWLIDVAAFGGAMAVSLLLFVLARRDLRSGIVDGNAPFLLLTGVIVASGCGALVTLMLSIAPDNRLRGMVFWLIGDLSGTQLRWLPWLVLTGALIFAIRMARAINVVALHAACSFVPRC